LHHGAKKRSPLWAVYDGLAAIRNRVRIHSLAARVLGDHGG
jgi:hypothetical protein